MLSPSVVITTQLTVERVIVVSNVCRSVNRLHSGARPLDKLRVARFKFPSAETQFVIQAGP